MVKYGEIETKKTQTDLFRFHAASYCFRKEATSDLAEKYKEARIWENWDLSE